ncbi:Protein of unknown function [Chryseobacterium taichungense]|uniref:DUF2931 family protein n=2 Tax=Chryseobacterium taichungense TaxID=295069 RepID=A0A1H8D2Y8_9FLAO|nr:Protein of unknown function [Chryseobacterium taichungense]
MQGTEKEKYNMDNMKYFLFVLIINLVECQKMNDEKNAFHVEICAPANKYRIEFVSDHIKTLEGTPAGLPYGGTSGTWGNSGKGWTEQYGTPIGADITYYSKYEDTFYRLNVDFPIDKIKDYMERAYPRWDDQYEETKEYKKLGRGYEAGNSEPKKSYDSFSTLVFGFAPRGMVVVWLRYNYFQQIELGRFQAQVIQDDKDLEKVMFSKTISVTRKEIRQTRLIPDASPLQWDNYRIRYNWHPLVTSENSHFEVMEIMNKYYNGEQENMLRPWVSNPPIRERAIPQELYVFWQTGKEDSERLQANIFFNWEEVNEAFKKAGNTIDMQIKISQDNKEVWVFLNNQPLKTDSIRIFGWTNSMLKGNWFKDLK